MGKLFTIFLCFCGYHASAQMKSGTLIVMHFTQDKFILAADSRQIPFRNGPPDDSKCKIATIGNQLVFASSAIDTLGSDGPVPVWLNLEAAKEAVRTSKEGVDSKARLVAIADRWSKIVTDRWRRMYTEDPKNVIAAAEHGNGLLVDGFFVTESDGEFPYTLRAVVVRNGEIVSYPGEPQCTDDYCGIGEIEIATEFTLAKTQRSKKEQSRWTADKRGEVWKTIRLVKLTERYDKRVGGPVDAIEFDKEGIHWAARKKNCPENQH